MKLSELSIGQTIFHKFFGEMVVKGLHPATTDIGEIATFTTKDGEKRLLLAYAIISATNEFDPEDQVIYEARIEANRQERISNGTSIPNSNNGGGTFFGDYIAQGCSNRHLQARNDSDKLTAGEMAKLLTKELKTKVLASDISEFATEWHHAGVFYNKYTKRTSGKKCYFFRVADKESLIEKLKAAAPAGISQL